MASEWRSLFVTGTDTGVGKTLISAAPLHTRARHHAPVVGIKPLAAGLMKQGASWVSEDVLALRALLGLADVGLVEGAGGWRGQ